MPLSGLLHAQLASAIASRSFQYSSVGIVVVSILGGLLVEELCYEVGSRSAGRLEQHAGCILPPARAVDIVEVAEVAHHPQAEVYELASVLLNELDQRLDIIFGQVALCSHVHAEDVFDADDPIADRVEGQVQVERPADKGLVVGGEPVRSLALLEDVFVRDEDDRTIELKAARVLVIVFVILTIRLELVGGEVRIVELAAQLAPRDHSLGGRVECLLQDVQGGVIVEDVIAVIDDQHVAFAAMLVKFDVASDRTYASCVEVDVAEAILLAEQVAFGDEGLADTRSARDDQATKLVVGDGHRRAVECVEPITNAVANGEVNGGCDLRCLTFVVAVLGNVVALVLFFDDVSVFHIVDGRVKEVVFANLPYGGANAGSGGVRHLLLNELQLVGW